MFYTGKHFGNDSSIIVTPECFYRGSVLFFKGSEF